MFVNETADCRNPPVSLFRTDICTEEPVRQGALYRSRGRSICFIGRFFTFGFPAAVHWNSWRRFGKVYLGKTPRITGRTQLCPAWVDGGFFSRKRIFVRQEIE